MSLRAGDSAETIEGRVIWVIGRSGAGKSTLIEAIRIVRPSVISLDDHLRVRTGIMGAERKAYDMMIGLSWSLAYQGHDVMLPCGAPTRELRDYIRSQIPNLQFVYIAERGRYYAGYEEPDPAEGIIILDGGLTTNEEVEILQERIWKQTSTTN
jgi:energy-coupling factor transporter ATP-binding protein EcfA2